jgi:hypothetical protein
MIPKKIHYCWFGGKPLPDDVIEYINSWRRFFPDFEIIQWDETNFNIDALKYTRQAYFAKRYAFVSDVARLYALLNEGGIYFDTDIIVKKPFPSEWFELDGFAGFEHDKYIQTGVIASCPKNPIIQEFLCSYRNRSFFNSFSFDITTNVVVFTSLMKKAGFNMNNQEQEIDCFRLFPQIYLCGNDWITGRYDTRETYAIHDFKGAWGHDAIKSIISFKVRALYIIIKWHIKDLIYKLKK